MYYGLLLLLYNKGAGAPTVQICPDGMILNPVHDAQLLSILDNMHAFKRQFCSIRASYSALYDDYTDTDLR